MWRLRRPSTFTSSAGGTPGRCDPRRSDTWVWKSITGKRARATCVSGTCSMLFGWNSVSGSVRAWSPAGCWLVPRACSSACAPPLPSAVPTSPVPAAANHPRRVHSGSRPAGSSLSLIACPRISSQYQSPVSSSQSSRQSPVASRQSPVASDQKPVTSNQSQVQSESRIPSRIPIPIPSAPSRRPDPEPRVAESRYDPNSSVPSPECRYYRHQVGGFHQDRQHRVRRQHKHRRLAAVRRSASILDVVVPELRRYDPLSVPIRSPCAPAADRVCCATRMFSFQLATDALRLIAEW